VAAVAHVALVAEEQPPAQRVQGPPLLSWRPILVRRWVSAR
jgi:hypothetical protein